jgi:energy-coupling factor transporter ATP-binding protein EcfA2
MSSKRGVIMAIDGLAGSGKTTLVKHLRKVYPHIISVCLDEFHFPHGHIGPEEYDYHRITKEVIIPFKTGKNLKYQRYNFGYDRKLDFDGLDE